MKMIEEPRYKENGIEKSIHCICCTNRGVIHGEGDPPGFFYDSYIYEYHYHDYIELLYSIEGEGSVWVNGEETPFCPGTLVIVNSRKAHGFTFVNDSRYFCIKLMPNILGENEQSFLNFKYVMPFVLDSEDQYVFLPEDIESSGIRELLEEIMAEWQEKGCAYELVVRANILKIFSILFKHWNSTGKHVNAGLPQEMARALQYTLANYKTVTEKEVADMCALSYNYFSYLFRRCVGKNFRDYLAAVKISEAEKLLLTTNMSVADIAEETGFSSVSYFISRFREQRGVTPARFRRKV